MRMRLFLLTVLIGAALQLIPAASASVSATAPPTTNPCLKADGSNGCWSLYVAKFDTNLDGKPDQTHYLGVSNNAPASLKAKYRALSNNDPAVTAGRWQSEPADTGPFSEGPRAGVVPLNRGVVPLNSSAANCSSECYGTIYPDGIWTNRPQGTGCSAVFISVTYTNETGIKVSTFSTYQRWCAIGTFADWNGYANGGNSSHYAVFSYLSGFYSIHEQPHWCCGFPYGGSAGGYGLQNFHDHATGVTQICIPALYCFRNRSTNNSWLHGRGSVYYHVYGTGGPAT